jgi:para-nitrobenzyl esterase
MAGTFSERLVTHGLCIVLLLVGCIGDGDVVVETEGGSVRGLANTSQWIQFYGIPYAAPPTGANRWRPPQPAAKWEGVRDGTQDNHAKCMQNFDDGITNVVTDGMIGGKWLQAILDKIWGNDAYENEDCLFVNVQTPQLQPAKLLPVMFYIHGGTNLIGTGNGYNASQICLRDVVFVSFNYRLGALGFAAFSDALVESSTTGNYGLQDQRAALGWVQRNIKAFGGDATRITLSGESSGAMAVTAHMALPRSRDLFARGIVMSGNDDSTPLQEALATGARFAEQLGCTLPYSREKWDGLKGALLKCLRGKTAKVIVEAQLTVYNQSMVGLQAPVEDGYELPVGVSLRSLYASGKVPPKPLLAGSNLNDSSLFFGNTPRVEFRGIGSHDIENSVQRFFPNMNQTVRDEIVKHYSEDNYGSTQLALYALGSDGYFECPTQRVLESFAASENVFHYIFAHAPAHPTYVLGMAPWLARILLWPFPPKWYRWLGSFHGSNEELFWYWDQESAQLTSDERKLGRRMQDVWTGFAHGLSPWEPYGLSKSYMTLDTDGETLGKEWHSEGCRIIENNRFVWKPLQHIFSAHNKLGEIIV